MSDLSPILVTAPAVTPISVAEAKSQCRVDHTDDDTLIGVLVNAVTTYVDGWRGILGRCLVNQTWKINLEEFCDDEILLPFGDLVSVGSVKYYDSSNTQQTVSSSYYSALQSVRGPIIALKSTYTWPVVYDREDAIEVQWTAGFGAAASNVPDAIRQAMLMHVAHLYDNRSAVTSDLAAMPMPLGAEALLAPYRMNPL